MVSYVQIDPRGPEIWQFKKIVFWKLPIILSPVWRNYWLTPSFIYIDTTKKYITGNIESISAEAPEYRNTLQIKTVFDAFNFNFLYLTLKILQFSHCLLTFYAYRRCIHSLKLKGWCLHLTHWKDRHGNMKNARNRNIPEYKQGESISAESPE